MVCGYLIAFAHLVGIRGGDLQNLTIGGMLHDIGKAEIPIDILDKPAKLNESEWTVMMTHPSLSRELFVREGGWASEIIDVAAFHHEKLDGTGYPDGLKEDQIPDIVRMVSIADVYSALVDKRSYKDSFSPDKALEIMLSMEGHLDPDLVKAFRPIALDLEHPSIEAA